MAAAGAAGGWVHATGRYRRWRAGAGPRTNRRLSFSGAGGPAPAAPGWVVLPPALVLFACLARRARERLRAPPGGGALSPAPPPGGGAPRRPAAAAPGGLGDLDALLGLRLSRLPGGGGDLPPGGLETASFADLWSTRGGRARGFEFTAAAAVGRPRPPAAAAPEGRPPSALTVVTLAGSELHAGAVRLAASLHFWHPEAELRVYHGGARLRPGDARVLAGLRNVRVVPLEEVWAALVEEEGAPLAGSGAARGRGGVRTWEPLVLLHALLDGGSPGGVAYVPPWLGLRGWVDNLRHALDRDGAFLLCGRPDDAGGGALASRVCRASPCRGGARSPPCSRRRRGARWRALRPPARLSGPAREEARTKFSSPSQGRGAATKGKPRPPPPLQRPEKTGTTPAGRGGPRRPGPCATRRSTSSWGPAPASA